jgi:transposase
VFQFVLLIASSKGLKAGRTLAVDATTLEANAAMKSIVRRNTGEAYQQYLTQLAAEAGLENPSDEDLRRFDKRRPGKTCSNDE